MGKPAKPGFDRDARINVTTDARCPVTPDDIHPGRAQETFGVSGLDASSDESNLNDAWLVEHARHGDHQAFAVLVRRYERKLIRVLTRLVREPEQARDLAQETFWRVYTRLGQFDTGRRFGPWLFRIGVNLGLDWLRRRDVPTPASINRSSVDAQRALELPDPDPRIRAELAQEVRFILERIPVAYRTILVLRDLEGFSSAEVAAIIN